MTLYIDTGHQKLITVALKKGEEVLDKLSEENEFGSQVLLPLIVKLLQPRGLDFSDLTGIEVEKGPGSFTGLKVGASVAQALGFALNIPVNGKVNKPIEVVYT